METNGSLKENETTAATNNRRNWKWSQLIELESSRSFLFFGSTAAAAAAAVRYYYYYFQFRPLSSISLLSNNNCTGRGAKREERRSPVLSFCIFHSLLFCLGANFTCAPSIARSLLLRNKHKGLLSHHLVSSFLFLLQLVFLTTAERSQFRDQR